MEYLQYIPITLLLIYGGLKFTLLRKKSNDVIEDDNDYIEFM